jgi:hypothetical protein
MFDDTRKFVVGRARYIVYSYHHLLELGGIRKSRSSVRQSCWICFLVRQRNNEFWRELFGAVSKKDEAQIMKELGY